MRNTKQPLYMIGVAAELCKVHPQTLRQYERLGLVVPARVGAKNRLYSEDDIETVRRIQRLTQEMGVNLAGVDIILKLLEDLEDMRDDFENQMTNYVRDVETRLQAQVANTNAPIRPDQTLLPVPQISFRRRTDV